MERQIKKLKRMCGPEDEDAQIEGIFEEELLDAKKRRQEAAQKNQDNIRMRKLGKK